MKLRTLFLLMDPKQTTKPKGIAPTKVKTNISRVLRNPEQSEARTDANIVKTKPMLPARRIS